MSKYEPLWAALKANGGVTIVLTFTEIRDILGFEVDHSFLNYKKEAAAYGYQVGGISLKEKHITFARTDG